ncbi:MAG: 50S ribosomal protein L16 [Parcubacteria group bacterium CG08_land_8_20_14_0_20_48_21]|nr:MAG: 50S ribosomal protein L16 [Parcubacteria group bacterium CG2_30_48_51]PIS32631.1 MAG: 50S ribosomal protein L16 [Parcubacteria group bacterium CG08_land_8_20_14_0_20_48_21]PIW79294.1 MAG: 50S ribosomal protein L16 [Parcubacteria group bacterium CG_4_8_14_3_um_filter_48_16]PIY77595.1 MAG: 50S ribosomal protein L16 [Parcubacteria group bacterium CG_4_10_14_0_8_um_filter_48_154]PIZ77180.1 MAG: 50S ribosomal protein L16 [bacterium CG_4_10_14_0_2_um_filter_48_144]PJC40134.1 MAG: 50S ribosom
MLAPKKIKHRKWHKGRIRGLATRMNAVSYGSYGLKATTASWVTSRQIEAARRVMTRYTKRTGKIWIRIFPDKPVTAKGNEIPMGGGKGAVEHYVAVVKPGCVMFEMEGVEEGQAREALELAAYKLPVKAKFVMKH